MISACRAIDVGHRPYTVARLTMFRLQPSVEPSRNHSVATDMVCGRMMTCNHVRIQPSCNKLSTPLMRLKSCEQNFALRYHEGFILFSQKKGKANDLIDAKLVGVKKIVTQAMEEEQVSKSHKISYRNFAIKYFGKTKN